mgnify:CR=1 FL=1
MALINLDIIPGIDKQNTTKGAERRWIDSDNVRFRYGLPEKVGGWSSLVDKSIVGVVRAQHPFLDKDGNRYCVRDRQKLHMAADKLANVNNKLNNMNTGGNEVDGSAGHCTMQEGAEDLFLINRNTGKKYKFLLQEVD